MSIQTETKAATYSVPFMRRIGRSDDTERLYALETKAHDAFRASAEELHSVLKKFQALPTASLYYTDALPEAIFSFLESQDIYASCLACFAFLDWYRANRPDNYEACKARFDESKG